MPPPRRVNPPAPAPTRLQDKFLKFKYDKTTVEAGKAFAKSQLQREVGLPVDPSAPLFGFIGGWRRLQRGRSWAQPGGNVAAGSWAERGACCTGQSRAGMLSAPCISACAPHWRTCLQAVWRSRRVWTLCWRR